MNNPETAVGPTKSAVPDVAGLSLALWRSTALFAATAALGLVAGFF